MRRSFAVLGLLAALGSALPGAARAEEGEASVFVSGGEVFVKRDGRTMPVLEERSLDRDTTLYVVHEGDHGTSVMVSVFNGVVWSKARDRALAILPWRYEAEDAPYELTQPVWSFAPGVVHVRDEETGVDEDVRY